MRALPTFWLGEGKRPGENFTGVGRQCRGPQKPFDDRVRGNAVFVPCLVGQRGARRGVGAVFARRLPVLAVWRENGGDHDVGAVERDLSGRDDAASGLEFHEPLRVWFHRQLDVPQNRRHQPA